MPKFLEKKLKSEYGKDSKIPYKVMNKLGAMRGNKETAKGRAMEKKHEKDKGRSYSSKVKKGSGFGTKGKKGRKGKGK